MPRIAALIIQPSLRHLVAGQRQRHHIGGIQHRANFQHLFWLNSVHHFVKHSCGHRGLCYTVDPQPLLLPLEVRWIQYMRSLLDFLRFTQSCQVTDCFAGSERVYIQGETKPFIRHRDKHDDRHGIPSV
jgi:hypothetical protein